MPDTRLQHASELHYNTLCSMLQQRRTVWAMIGFIALVSSVAPLFDTAACDVSAKFQPKKVFHGPDETLRISPQNWITGEYSSSRAPRLGSHFLVTFVTAIVFGALVHPQRGYKWDKVSHIWIGRYAMALCSQWLITVFAEPWVFAVCRRHRDMLKTSAFVIDLAKVFSYNMSVAVTLYLMVLRLCGMEHMAASTLLRLNRCILFCYAITPIIILLSTFKEIAFVTHLLFAILMFVWRGLMVAFACVASRAFWTSALVAELVNDEAAVTAAWWLRLTAGIVVASVATSELTVVANLGLIYIDEYWLDLTQEIIYSVDISTNAFCNLLCAGFIGPSAGVEAAVSIVGAERRAQQIRAKLVRDAEGQIGQAAPRISAMLDGKDANDLINEASMRFRCISWDTLQERSDLVLQSTTLDGMTAPTELYALSEQCDLGDCDAFLSHSWHDDATLKWEALATWCEEFRYIHQRAPRLWFDKVCINQNSIAEDLRCLPIFLAACNLLLILCGDTYTNRLWCCVELFVYVAMLDEDGSRGSPIIRNLGFGDVDQARTRQLWTTFDARNCKCFKQEDKDRIMQFIESCPGGVTGFSEHVRTLAASALTSQDAAMRGTQVDCSIRLVAL